MYAYADFSKRIVELLHLDCPLPVDPGSSLYDELAIDSFQAFELIVLIEAMANVQVPPAVVPELYTMADAFQYFQVLVGEREDLQ